MELSDTPGPELSCSTAQELIHPYIDGELDQGQTPALRRHLHQCESCRHGFRNQLTLHAILKDSALYHHAPHALQNRIRASLRAEIKTETIERSLRLR